MSAHPIFQATLDTIYPIRQEKPMERIPCRVTADLRIKDQQETAAHLEAPEFTYLEEDFRQIVPKELARPLELLFGTRDQVEAIRGSFGDESVDSKKAVDWLMEDLRRLEVEILTLWENA